MIFLTNYGLFLAKTTTLVVAIAVVLMLIFALKAKAKLMAEMGSLTVKKLNEKYEDMADTLLDLTQSKAEKKAAKKALKKRKTEETAPKKRIFVLRFDGDIKASGVDSLRET